MSALVTMRARTLSVNGGLPYEVRGIHLHSQSVSVDNSRKFFREGNASVKTNESDFIQRVSNNEQAHKNFVIKPTRQYSGYWKKSIKLPLKLPGPVKTIKQVDFDFRKERQQPVARLLPQSSLQNSLELI